jgi:hypothetical protein
MEIIESIMWVAAGFVPTLLSMEALTRRAEKESHIGGRDKIVQKEVIMHRE